MIIDLASDFLTRCFKRIGKEYLEIFYKNLQIEQIAYRIYLCEKCVDNGKCESCGCTPLDVLLEPFSCNEGRIFPNFMNYENWESFKQQNNITVENELRL